MCKACFDGQPIDVPGIPPEEGRVKAKFDASALQADRNAGMKIADVAKRHGCSVATVCLRTTAPGGPPRPKELSPKAAKQFVAEHLPTTYRPQIATARFNAEPVLEELRAYRERIDRAIEAFEAL